MSEAPAEPIVGSTPSAYDGAIVLGEDEAEPIVGPPSPYQEVVVFPECEVEPIIGAAPSAYHPATTSVVPETPHSGYDDVIHVPDAEEELAAQPRESSPYGAVTAVPDLTRTPPLAPAPRSPYTGVIAGPRLAGDGRGPLRRGVISWELVEAWDLPRPEANLGSLSEADLQVLSWLEAHEAKIVDVERRRRVDRRAIAAAIAWEALENTAWPFSRRAVGVGKVHLKSSVVHQVEAAGYVPVRTDEQRKSLLRNSDEAIEYIGAIMEAHADIAEDAGHDIRQRVDILTNEYNGRDLEDWEHHLAGKEVGAPLIPGNDMALWSRDKIWYVEQAVGTPDPAVFTAPGESPQQRGSEIPPVRHRHNTAATTEGQHPDTLNSSGSADVPGSERKYFECDTCIGSPTAEGSSRGKCTWTL
ncbi:hypothetical protein SAMN05660350_04548 [Geodermatophilus obscurus]|uniref:Uncharacterized protein n=1 Tax=Geodermatophilus obscurus TaxID=1861 RepID=A0A1M7UZZ1_9ACTN|nr:hypothetical protein [Geodermatophilus obscurus]SHN88514.1 hypothetical protein SAMN05660350_04548 [Geodermatophilus obscurus]